MPHTLYHAKIYLLNNDPLCFNFVSKCKTEAGVHMEVMEYVAVHGYRIDEECKPEIYSVSIARDKNKKDHRIIVADNIQPAIKALTMALSDNDTGNYARELITKALNQLQ